LHLAIYLHEDPGTYVAKLRCWFDEIRPTLTSTHGRKNVIVHLDLQDSSYVFLRKDPVEKYLKDHMMGHSKC